MVNLLKSLKHQLVKNRTNLFSTRGTMVTSLRIGCFNTHYLSAKISNGLTDRKRTQLHCKLD